MTDKYRILEALSEEKRDKRMTDERLAEIEHLNSLGGPGVVRELLQAMKAERKSLNDCARDNTKFRQRISELEAKLERVRELPDQWIDKSFDPLFDADDCADELDQALADD